MIVCLLYISNSPFPRTSRQSSHRCRCSGRVQRCSYVKQLSHAARQLAASIHFNEGRAAEGRRQKRLLPRGRVCPPPTDFHSQCPNGIEWGYAYFMKCFEWRFLLSRPTWNSASIKWLEFFFFSSEGQRESRRAYGQLPKQPEQPPCARPCILNLFLTGPQYESRQPIMQGI